MNMQLTHTELSNTRTTKKIGCSNKPEKKKKKNTETENCMVKQDENDDLSLFCCCQTNCMMNFS